MFNYNVSMNSQRVMSLKTAIQPCPFRYNVNINSETGYEA